MNGDLSEQLQKMLSDPAAMSQVMQIAGSLMGQSTPAAPADSAASPQDSPQQDAAADAAAAMPSLPPELPKLLGALTADGASDPRASLLIALKPYLSDARRERADALIRALKLAAVAEKFLTEGGK